MLYNAKSLCNTTVTTTNKPKNYEPKTEKSESYVRVLKKHHASMRPQPTTWKHGIAP